MTSQRDLSFDSWKMPREPSSEAGRALKMEGTMGTKETEKSSRALSGGSNFQQGWNGPHIM